MTYIRFFFALYWFAPFLKFGTLPSENPRCAPAAKLLVGMRNLQDTFETRKQSFISAFSICMALPLKSQHK